MYFIFHIVKMLFTIVMIDNDDYLQTRFIRLYLVGELTNIDGTEILNASETEGRYSYYGFE